MLSLEMWLKLWRLMGKIGLKKRHFNHCSYNFTIISESILRFSRLKLLCILLLFFHPHIFIFFSACQKRSTQLVFIPPNTTPGQTVDVEWPIGGNLSVVPKQPVPEIAGSVLYVDLGVGVLPEPGRVKFVNGKYIVREGDNRVLAVRNREGKCAAFISAHDHHYGNRRKDITEEFGMTSCQFFINSDGSISPYLYHSSPYHSNPPLFLGIRRPSKRNGNNHETTPADYSPHPDWVRSISILTH